jgi:hypothetical protein
MPGRIQMSEVLSDMAAVLKSELAALRIWQSATKPGGDLAVPAEIWDGMTISVDKIETVLIRMKHINPGRPGLHFYELGEAHGIQRRKKNTSKSPSGGSQGRYSCRVQQILSSWH